MTPSRPLLPLLAASTLAVSTLLPTHAADAAFFGLVKLRQYAQTPGGNPAELPSNGFSFQAFVIASTNNAVTNATVSFKPSASAVTRTLLPLADGLGLRFEEYFNTLDALDAAYPAGGGFSVVTYTNSLHTLNDGLRRANLTFWIAPPFLSITAPTTPAIANLPDAQDIDTSSDFTLRWNSVGTALTLLQLTILDLSSNVVFASPIPFQDGALNGASNAIVLPAHTLPVNARFEGHLTAANPGLPNTNAYPGAIGVATLAKDLSFPLATRSVPPPTLTLTPNPSDTFHLHLAGQPNYYHRLEASQDLLAWTTLALTNPPDGHLHYLDPAPLPNAHRFYRARTER